MNNVVSLDQYKKKYFSHDERIKRMKKQIAETHNKKYPEDKIEFPEKLQRIQNSLHKINALMQEMRSK